MPTTVARAARRLRKSSAPRTPRRPSPARSIRPRSAPASPSLPASPEPHRPVPSISRDGGRSISGCSAQSPLRHRQHPHRDLHHERPHHRHAQHRRQLRGRCQQRRLEQPPLRKSSAPRTPRRSSPARSIRPRSAPASPSLPASPDPRRPVPSISRDGGRSISGCSARSPLRHRQHPHRDLHHERPDHRHAQHRRQLPGDANNGGSSSTPLAQVVGSANTTTTLTSSLNPASLGASVTFTASVTGSAPTGTVNFPTAAGRSAAARPETLSGTGNTRTATCTTSGLTTGTHSIVASYPGDANNGGSSSTPLVASRRLREHHDEPRPARSIRPRSVPASPSLPASPESAPTGTVDFRDGGSSISGCSARSPLRHRQHPHRDLHHERPDHRHAQHRRQLSRAMPTTVARAVRRLSQVVGSAKHRDDPHQLAQSGLARRERHLHRQRHRIRADRHRRFHATAAASISGCSARSLSGTGNTRTATCTTSAPDDRHAQHRRQLGGRCQQRRLEQRAAVASRRLGEHHDDASPARSIRPRSAPASPSLPASPGRRRPVPSISPMAARRSAAARPGPSPAPATPGPRPAPPRPSPPARTASSPTIRAMPTTRCRAARRLSQVVGIGKHGDHPH